MRSQAGWWSSIVSPSGSAISCWPAATRVLRSTALAVAIGGLAGPAILVSNEVGMGIVPDHKLGREFRDWQGRANRDIGAACDAVIFVAAGFPLQLKPAATPSVQLG